TVLSEVSGHISNFGDKLNEYTGLLADEAKVSQQLAASAKTVVQQVNHAYDVEDQSVSSELQANTLKIIGSSVLALLVGLIAALVITRLIVAPLRSVIATAQRIASGDLSGNVPVNRRDEI